MAGRVVVVFDFDKTILDCDSDNWVVDELGVNHLFTQLLPTMPWNSLMDRMMMELHSRGKTMEDIAHCLKQAPCDLKILSDANVFFIETILKHHDEKLQGEEEKLVEGDILMARNKFPVWDLIISSNPLSIKAHIHPWNDGEDLGIALLNLINTIFIQRQLQL
ncbi:hypothetical protein EZV62_012551 [Acer yangbiense]|uniref:Uncharacterized protein n=1 Tax=Acer yangbiense TaxID=1000413 RepID=A0A5C7HWL1_9ROSI|nr:hypothetical protein EZV62_012551 [Acer yangbiense]